MVKKIVIAVAFGVISPQMGEHFQSIRHIRNAFAHARLPISFDTPQVAKEISELGTVKAIFDAVTTHVTQRTPPDPTPKWTGKDAYLVTVSILMIMLDHDYQKRGLGRLYDDGKGPTPT